MHVVFRSKAPEILLELLKGPRKMRELVEAVGGSATTIEQRIEELKEAGLVDEEKEKKFPFTRKIMLTSKGEGIARIIEFLRKYYEKIPLKKDKWILLLLHGVGMVKGKTKLQKLIFIMQENLKEHLPDEEYYDFKPYYYGPFSKELLDDAEFLMFQGLIEISEEPVEVDGEEVTMPVYKLTKVGREEARKVREQISERISSQILDDILRKIAYFNRLSAKKLTEIVHKSYPGYVLEK